MKFFIPEWNDRVDPNYDFKNDNHSKLHCENPARNDVYMWDIFGIEKVPFDGLLVSRIVLEQEKKKNKQILEEGIHSVLRLPKTFEIIGDCGAFGYINQKTPPYDPIEILEYYQRSGFNYGVSVDHLVVPQYADEKDERIRITYENGIKAFKEWSIKYKNDFQLLLAIQGWEIPDYLKMYKKYIDLGATHLAFGGLVRCPTDYVKDLIEKLIVESRSYKKLPEYIHFFGLARAALFPQLKQLEDLGVTVGFDSASYLRKAWLSAPTSEMNYLTPNGFGYTAIRIPFTKKTTKQEPSQTDECITVLEKKCLQELKAYEEKQKNIQSVLSSLTEFSRESGAGTELLEFYKRTLSDRPWANCDCPICRSIGIDVVVFRGNNRNRRRGFHNVNVFYKIVKNEKLWQPFIEKTRPNDNPLKALKKGERTLIITECSKGKIGYNPQTKVPAKNLYTGRLFLTVKQYAKSMNLDFVIISAKYGLVMPDEVIEGYEKVLKTSEDVKAIQPLVENKLKTILEDYDKVIVIAGEKYKNALRTLWDQRFISIRSRGYGDLCSIINHETKVEKSLVEFT